MLPQTSSQRLLHLSGGSHGNSPISLVPTFGISHFQVAVTKITDINTGGEERFVCACDSQGVIHGCSAPCPWAEHQSDRRHSGSYSPCDRQMGSKAGRRNQVFHKDNLRTLLPSSPNSQHFITSKTALWLGTEHSTHK